MSDKEFSFVTDTATMCVFDVVCLKHRLKDYADWWTTPDAELSEVNAGSVAFIGLGDDGKYTVSIVRELHSAQAEVCLRVPSGRVFIGAGEEVTSDGLEPEAIRGGAFIELDPGNYKMLVRKERASLLIKFIGSEGSTNSFKNPIRLL